MAYTLPTVVSLERNVPSANQASCTVRYTDSTVPAPNHRTINVTAIIPFGANDQDDVIRARAISVARQAISDAKDAP